MFVSHYNFGLMFVHFVFADGDSRQTNVAYGYQAAMDLVRRVHKAFTIEQATFVDSETGEVIADVFPEDE